jgi:death-on-curing protein
VSTLAFSREEVLAIHAAAIDRFGGLDGLRDEGLLDSALTQPFQTFGGTDLYPSAIEKACRYAFGIISDHPFLDGNKRTGAALLGAYLRNSGVEFKPDHAAFLRVMLGVADGSVDYGMLVEWVKGVGHERV